jgi:hypothetical protein
MEVKIANACQGKTASQGGMNIPELYALSVKRGYKGGKKRSDLITYLCPKPKSKAKPKPKAKARQEPEAKSKIKRKPKARQEPDTKSGPQPKPKAKSAITILSKSIGTFIVPKKQFKLKAKPKAAAESTPKARAKFKLKAKPKAAAVESTPKAQIKRTANQINLETYGYIVVPTELTNKSYREFVVGELDIEVKTEWNKREYKVDAFEDTDHPIMDSTTKFVGGGFSALGNPSSFHSMVVRHLRRIAHNAMVNENPFELGSEYKVSQVIDRLMKRIPGAAPGKESWHRDVATNTKEGDIVFGGWINLDGSDQYFSCIPGTHNDAVSTSSGFVVNLLQSDKDKITAHQKLKKKPLVRIPPGCMLIFNERLIHEVVSKKASKTMLRLFTGWYVSKTDQPHDSRPNDGVATDKTNKKRLIDRLNKQAAMYIKSGQMPPMAPPLHWCNYPHLIAGYTDKLRDAATNMRPRNPTRAKPNPIPSAYRTPYRSESEGIRNFPKKEIWTTLDSLWTMKNIDGSIEIWPKYSDDDINILLPMTLDQARKLVTK